MNEKVKIKVQEIAGVDIGNSNVKLAWGKGELDRLMIPNVIARAPKERPYFEPEKDPLMGLHVSINSKAVNGSFFVGNLAAKAEDKDEVRSAVKKSENYQHMVMLLTVLAYRAALKAKSLNGNVNMTGKEIAAIYYLGTSLPVQECKDLKAQPRFKKSLSGTHYVEFLQTPGLEGLYVEVRIEDATVGTEGVPAIIALTTDHDGSMRNEEIANSTVMAADIGGGSMDFPIVGPEGVMNTYTDGNYIGTNHYLDQIIQDLSIKKEVQIKSRDQLTQYLLKGKYDIAYKGSHYNIKDVVDEHLGKLAQKAYSAIDNQWSKMPEIEYCYLVGGGAVLLPTYLKQINEAPGVKPLPIRFCTPIEESVWLNAVGSLIVANVTFGTLIEKSPTGGEADE